LPTRARTSARCWAPSTISATGRSCTPTIGVLPLREAAWAAWNYEAGREPADETTAVCVHVLVNRLQRCRSRCR
jgi:hypothetical protein